MSLPKRYEYVDNDAGCCGGYKTSKEVKRPKNKSIQVREDCSCGKHRAYKICIEGEVVVDLNDPDQPEIHNVEVDEAESITDLYWGIRERHILINGDSDEEIKYKFNPIVLRARDGGQVEFPLHFRVAIRPVISTGCKNLTADKSTCSSERELSKHTDPTSYREEIYHSSSEEIFWKPLAESSRLDVTFCDNSTQTDFPYEDDEE